MPKKKLTREEKLELLEQIRNDKKIYEIMIGGYGGEIVVGTITKEQYEFWQGREDLDEHCNDWDNEIDIPNEMKLVEDGSWYDRDNLAHETGAEFSASNYITVTDKETGETVWESSLDIESLEKNGVWVDGINVDEYYVRYDSSAEYAFMAQSVEKGCFYTGEIETHGKFDPWKLNLSYIDVEGWNLINGVSYASEIVEDTGGYSTTGKGLDFKIFEVKNSG